jgi:glycine/D-amino acid oxidase-like deaminating enzyme
VIFSEQTPQRFNSALPAETDVVVIGGGVIGVCTALFLARQGVRVLLCDKGRVAGEQSSRNWGWVRQQGRDPAELPIVMESLRLWQQLQADTGRDLGYAVGGVMFLAEDDGDMPEFEQWLKTAAEHGLDSRLLSGREVDGVLNSKAGQWHAGLYTPSDARAEPFKAVPALADSLHELGVPIREACAVRTVEFAAGRVCGVVTEHGAVRCQQVLLAGGAWSSLFLRNLGLRLPQLTVRYTVARTEPASEIFPGAALSHDLAFRRRQDGGYTLALSDHAEHYVGADSFRFSADFLPALRRSWKETSVRFGSAPVRRATRPARWSGEDQTPFEQTRVWNPVPSRWALEQMRQRLARRYPALAGTGLAEAWAGMVDALPDIVPVMDEAAEYPGLFIATGFSGHGFGIGPGAGRVMADLIQGKPAGHDLHRFRLSRFSDGSALQIGPAL